MGPQADKAWATGKGARRARTQPVPKSRVRKIRIVMIFAEMFITFLRISKSASIIPKFDGRKIEHLTII